MARKPNRARREKSTSPKSVLHRPREPKLIDKILDYPYGKLFGLRGQLVIGSVIIVVLVIRFFTGISTVTLDPLTCKLAWADEVYELFHKQRILLNTRYELNRLLAEKQTALRQINDGRSPFSSPSDGNVVRAKKINKDKFFWRSYANNLRKENTAIIKCMGRLPTYRFD